jgi:hypothetical protein
MYLDPITVKHLKERLSFWRGLSATLAGVLFVVVCALIAHGWS